MTLKERITEDMKAAMRAKDAERLGAIRMLTAAIKQKEVDERVELDDAGVVGIVDKLLKQRKDSIEAFQKAGRQDLADKEQAEISVLTEFLPAALTETELADLIKQAIANSSAEGMKDMGKVMAALKAKHGGSLDMAKAGPLVKAALAG